MFKIFSALRHFMIITFFIVVPQGAAVAQSEAFHQDVGHLSALLRICGDHSSRMRLDQSFGSHAAYLGARDQWLRHYRSADGFRRLDCARFKSLATGLDPAQPRSLPPFRVESYVDP